jgi:NAD(P)H dehydrogenase (quinone)
MTKIISIVYHSGYGHTEKVAKHVLEGINSVAQIESHLLKADALTEKDWETLDKSDAIIFGSPTYMGGVSGPFKMFLDQTSQRWFNSKWKNKIAAGFTNSSSYSGDKLATLQQMMIVAMQHGMLWVGLDVSGPQKKGTEVPSVLEHNRIGSYSGLMTQSNNDSPEITPPQGDLETAKLFGIRVAEITKKFMA